MQNSQDLLLVLGMAAVTYLPRLLPMLLLSTDKLPPVLKRFFDFVPYAVLTTLIFPRFFFDRTAGFGRRRRGSLPSVSRMAERIFSGRDRGIGGVFLWELLF